MAFKRGSTYLLLGAALSPWLYDRYQTLSTLWTNRPGHYPSLHPAGTKVLFQDRIRNCEDILVEDSMGIAFLSCDPGRDRWNTVMGSFHEPIGDGIGTDNGQIWIYDYSNPSLAEKHALKPLQLLKYKPGNPPDLHPLGLEFDGATSTLYVVNHARSGTVIDIFQIDVKHATATFVKTHTHPLLHTPNSILSLGDGKLLITNDHYFRARVSKALSQIETFSGIAGGHIVYTNTRDAQDTHEVARVPFANGIVRLNATTVAVASSSKAGVYFYTLGEGPSLQLVNIVRTPAAVDNLSVDASGKLLLAGHPFALGLIKTAKGRATCNMFGTEEEKNACACNAMSWAAEWTEERGLVDVYRDDGAEFCSSCTFARDVGRGVNFVSGLYERGVLVFRE